ncbi:MAG TPA: hypothetical protein PKD76_00085 [Solirubrobacterales bacterium]|nr:hypothetical protein [Solirubrobacterales bacterium]
MNGGGAFGALIFVVGLLIVFAILFSAFLVIPFFVFLGGIVAMLISDRKRDSGDTSSNGNSASESVDTVEVIETTTEVREVRR